MSHPARANAQYTVVLRAHAAARFLPEEGWEIVVNAPSMDVEGVRLRTFTRWVDDGGQQVPRELVVEVRGQTGSLDEATAKFAALARPLVTLVGFVANVLVGPLEVHLAYDSTPSSSDRAFLETFLPDEHGAVSEGRIIRRHLLEAAGPAYITLTADSARVGRALRQYELALRQWYVGGEWLALNHLWIAAENLSKAVIRKIVSERGTTEEDFAHEYNLVTDDPKQPRWRDLLAARAREAIIFAGDTDTYKTAKDASDGLEHGIWELDKIAAHALKSADKTFGYIRQTIATLLGLNPEVVAELMEIKPKDVQSQRKVARGRLLGAVADPAMEGELYPRLEWTSGIDSVVREGSTFQMRQKDRMTIRTHPDVGFRMERLEVHGRLADGQVPVQLNDQDIVLEHTPAAAALGLLEAVMLQVDTTSATGSDRQHSAPSFFAFNMFGQAVAFLQAVEALVKASLPVEALGSLRGLTIIAARFEQMADPAGPGPGVAVRGVLDSVATTGADSELIAARLREVTAAAEAVGVAIPVELDDPEASTIFRSLGVEMQWAADVVSGTYGATGLHTARIDEEHAGFRTKLDQGPLTDLVVSAAAISMLETLTHASELFGWRADTKAISTILAKARAVNDAAAQLDLLPPALHGVTRSDPIRDPKADWPSCQGPATVVIHPQDCRYAGCERHGKFESDQLPGTARPS